MLRRIVARGAAVAIGAALVAPVPASAIHGPASYQRMYLLAENDGRLFWSLDADEPTAERRSIRRACPDLPRLPGMDPCRGAATAQGHPFTVWFQPRSRLAHPIEWSSAAPVRFRFALEVETSSPYTVQLAWGDGGAAFQNATQTAPGIWEGTFSQRAMIDPTRLPELGVRVTLSPAGVASFTLRTDGSSYLEFPELFKGWTFQNLQARSPAPEEATSYSSALRSFRFNDDGWEVFEMAGDLTETRAFPVEVDDRAAWLIAWVETFAEPWVHHLVRNREIPPDRMTDTPRMRLLRDGQPIAYGVNLEDEQTGRGTDQLAILDVDPGNLTLEIIPSDFAQGASYKAYALVGYGERTLRSMRTRFAPNHFYFNPTAQLFGVGVCPGNAERVPLTSAVRATHLDIDWDTVNPLADWTIRWTGPGGADLPCGWAGSGDDLKVVYDSYVMPFGATPAYDDNHVAYRDTVIDAEVELFYEPPPHPEEGET